MGFTSNYLKHHYGNQDNDEESRTVYHVTETRQGRDERKQSEYEARMQEVQRAKYDRNIQAMIFIIIAGIAFLIYALK